MPNEKEPFGFRDGISHPAIEGSGIPGSNPKEEPLKAGEFVLARIHRMIRRGTAYGPLLPEGVLDDDGADRGLMFAFVGAHIGRQFEFVQSEWINDGIFFGAGAD